MRGVFFLLGFVLAMIMAVAISAPLVVQLKKQVDDAHAPATGYHLPITIPSTRIFSATPGCDIPPDAVFFCARDLSECIHRNMTNVQKFTPSCNTHGKCRVLVEFHTRTSWLEIICVFVSILISTGMSLLLLGTISLNIIHGPNNNINSTSGPNYNLRHVFCEAIELGTPNNPCNWAAYSDAASLVVYTPEDGLCICRPPSHPVLPAYRLHKVEKPTRPARVSMPWGEAICQTNTGVRMDVCRGLGIEWRADGGLRVWATVDGRDVAYDSVAIEK